MNFSACQCSTFFYLIRNKYTRLYKSPASAGITSFKRYPLSVKQSGEGFAGGMEIFSSYKIKAIRDAPSRGLLVSLSLLSFFFFSRLFYFSRRFLFFLHIATKGSSWRKMLSQRNSASLQNAFKCRAFIPPRLQMHLRKRTRLRMRFIRQLLICKAVDDAIVDGGKASERASERSVRIDAFKRQNRESVTHCCLLIYITAVRTRSHVLLEI